MENIKSDRKGGFKKGFLRRKKTVLQTRVLSSDIFSFFDAFS